MGNYYAFSKDPIIRYNKDFIMCLSTYNVLSHCNFSDINNILPVYFVSVVKIRDGFIYNS